MANTTATLNPEKWMSDIQDYLNAMLVCDGISESRKFDGMVNSGDAINFPYINDMRVQDYTPGTDATIDDFTATQSTLTIDQSKLVGTYIDPQELKQAEAKGYPERLARQAAFVIAQELDQNVIQAGVTNAAATAVVGGALSSATIYTALTDSMANLDRENATDGPMFAVIDPERCALLAQSEVANGYNLADSALKNGFVGDSQAGFKIFKSNNLPYAVTVTIATQPTNLDTITIAGVTWTCVTDGTAANAGEIAIGANIADFKTIFVVAMNGTGTAGASAYIDVSTANRRKYQNIQLTAATFSGDTCALTAYGKMSASETFTDATDSFGTETSQILTGRVGAISVARQMKPQLRIKPVPAQLGDNYLTHQLYGSAVFYRDTFRLGTITHNA